MERGRGGVGDEWMAWKMWKRTDGNVRQMKWNCDMDGEEGEKAYILSQSPTPSYRAYNDFPVMTPTHQY